MSDQRTRSMTELLRKEYGMLTQMGPESGVVVAGLAVQKLVSNNDSRVGLVFMNTSASSVYIDTENNPSAATGLLLSANGGQVSFDWRVDGALITNDWYVLGTAAALNVKVIELVLQ